MAMAKIEFGNIAMQVLLGAMLIDAVHAALEYAVIAFTLFMLLTVPVMRSV